VVNISHCKECDRWKKPPYMVMEPDSPQMLAFLLKQVKGINKSTTIIDASFIWTEPNSKRLKAKVTIQKEVADIGIALQGKIVVEFVIINDQCDQCKRTYTPHLWRAQVQVR